MDKERSFYDEYKDNIHAVGLPVYWYEWDRLQGDAFSYQVKTGYYLCSYYDQLDVLQHIVTATLAKSCNVVRHIKDSELYPDPEPVNEIVANLNKFVGRQEDGKK